MTFPYTHWEPLSLPEAAQLFRDAPFAWGVAGGYAVEQFLGRAIRPHDDIDLVVFRDDQRAVQGWLSGWHLFAADPPGTLRPWVVGEWLPFGIHDIWGHRAGAGAWQLQLMLLEAEGDEWYSRRDARIRGARKDLLVRYGGLPCVRIEVQLMYKAKGNRPKDQLDFQASVPLMTPEARAWLAQALRCEHPGGHPWIAALA